MPSVGYGDLPATEDELGFDPAIKTLTKIIQDAQQADTPLTIGIYGPWGSGKTSMMRMILEKLDYTKCVTVWFDAWRYAQQDALWRTLLLCVVEALRERVRYDDGWLREYCKLNARATSELERLQEARTDINRQLDDLIACLYISVEQEEPGEIQFRWDQAGKLIVNMLIHAGFQYMPVLGNIMAAFATSGEQAGDEGYTTNILDLFQREHTRIYREKIQSLEQFYEKLKKLIKELVTDLDRKLVLFIDDLDRCLPEQAIGVLESIKVFLDIPGCVFVIGVDREIIERGIRVHYKDFALGETNATAPFPVAERDYLEKIVQIPFTLPPLAPQVIKGFLQKQLKKAKVEGLDDQEIDQVANLMTVGLIRNPRKVKRSFNIFRLHLMLDRAYGRQTRVGLIAKLTIIQTGFAVLYDRIARDPMLLRHIESSILGLPGSTSAPPELRDELRSKEYERLREMLQQEPFFDSLSDDELRELVYQSRITDDNPTSTT
ncbi:KAP family P-loop NTPase fold protein [Chloroflexus sp.]|uniref:KAP family P-loop NTPase fold protein n=1 Tax=Chloroflexus sp. TaxID=1904827 RepID=UPI0026304A12|nr:P-loop NTPase fold protein [uncultured Chloroflexus sp.]